MISRHKSRALFVVLAGLLARLLSDPAGSLADSGEPLPAPGGSALEILEREIRESPPPVDPPGPRLGLPILATAASVGSAALALAVARDEDPESNGENGEWNGNGDEGSFSDSFWLGGGWGALQGYFVDSFIAMGLALLLFPPPDRRAEYGSLLDLSEPEREQQAYRILRQRAERAKRERVIGGLLMVGVSVLPAGVYYLGSALVGTTPKVGEFGAGYVAGLLLGSLPLAMIFAFKSDEEKVLAELDAAGTGARR